MPTHAFGDGALHPRTRRIRLLKSFSPLLASTLLQRLMYLAGVKRHRSSALLTRGALGFGLTALADLSGKAHLDHLLAAVAHVWFPRLQDWPFRPRAFRRCPFRSK